MSTDTLEVTAHAARWETGSPDLSRVRDEWALLAELVQEYDPTVVILVARKPVRMFQALHLEPAPGALVISDLAISFMADRLVGARVAVIDDVVNVGSTIRRACRRAEGAGAGELQAFAISRIERDQPLPGLDVRYSGSTKLDEFDLQQFGRRVPQTLQWVSKPYDLSFPVMECDVLAPFGSFDNLLAAMSQRYGGEHVYDVSTPAGARRGMRRCAIDLSAGEEHRKVRLHVDEVARRCTVVPILITPVLHGDGPAIRPSAWAEGVWDALHSLPTPSDLEARCRLTMFVDSLTLGESFLSQNAGILRPRDERPFNIEDAELALGPAIGRAKPAPAGARKLTKGTGPEERKFCSVASPFLEAAKSRNFVEHVARRARARDPLSVFIACFEELALQVGANEPADYWFGWPYTYQEIQEEPHRRLQIGPTTADLVSIIDTITGADDLDATRRRITRLLDRYIYSGGVVPVVAAYGDQAFRIYRQGESATRDDVSRKVRYAWNRFGKPLSLTRATKYLTILALDEEQGPDSQVEIGAAPRGNTLRFHRSVLDVPTEITQYLRDTRQLRQVDKT